MAIRKNAPNYLRITKQPFTTLLNKTLDLIPDAAAMGIYVYLSSKQNDWIIQEKDLMNRFHVGRDFIRSRMKVLKELGLLIKEAVRDDKGRIIHWETILLNEITENPSSGQNNIQITENPAPGKPRHLENPTHINKRINEINNNINNISTSGEVRNVGYNKFDGEVVKKEKSDYKSNQLQVEKNDSQVLEKEINIAKSDYCENQSINKSFRQNKIQYSLKNIQEENIFQIPEQVIADWIENRKKKRVPITKTSWNKINKELAKCKEQGIEPVDAFEKMVAHGWQGLDADWFQKEKKGTSSSPQWDVDSVMRA